MGVQARIILYARSRQAAESAARAAYERVAALEQVMSDYRPSSELMRLCKRAGGPPVRVSPDLLRVLMASLARSRESDGAFDPTVGPLVALWRKARATATLPDPTALAAARALVDWRNVAIDTRACTARLKLRGMRLDLGGIGKGCALDRAMEVLRGHGVTRALMQMGGDIVTGDPPPGKRGWTIEIENAGPRGETRTILSAHQGVSTSGDTEQYVKIGGKRYSHVVDPHTGLGLTDHIAVTVIAPNAALSDGLSTTICVLGEARGRALAARHPQVCAIIRTLGRHVLKVSH